MLSTEPHHSEHSVNMCAYMPTHVYEHVSGICDTGNVLVLGLNTMQVQTNPLISTASVPTLFVLLQNSEHH